MKDMTTTLDRFRHRYSIAFNRYLEESAEQSLHAAYELGREAVTEQLSMLELASLHHAVVGATLRHFDGDDGTAVMDAAADFFLQVLSAFEMVQRGFREAQLEIALEKRHAGQLHELADAFVAINSRLSVREAGRLVTERARVIVDAHCSVIFLSGHLLKPDVQLISCSDPFAHLRRDFEAVQPTELAEFASRIRASARASSGGIAPGLSSPPFGVALRDATDFLLTPLIGQRVDWRGFILVVKFEGSFSDKDESILVQLASMLSSSIDNAHLYQQQHRIAETLQRALLPTQLPYLPGIALATRYVPGAAGVSVGGDWFDIVSLPRRCTGMAVGDVMGRGVRAASIMGQMRTAFRAYALAEGEPQAVVTRLNQLITSLDPEHFSTLVYVVWNPLDRIARIVRAGHPPPLLIAPGGETRYLDGNVSVPLGVHPSAEYNAVKIAILPASTLLLYTDGLVEQENGLDDGLSRLRRVASENDSTTLDELCDRVLERMIPGDATDDIALVALQLS